MKEFENSIHTEQQTFASPDVRQETPFLLTDRAVVMTSLNSFVDDWNEQQYPHHDGRLVLSHTLLGEGPKYLGRHEGRFYTDGDFGVGLGVASATDTIWLAVTSFHSGDSLNAYVKKSTGVERMFPADIPVITQLQALSLDDTYTNPIIEERARQLLKNFRWERTLVTAVTAWAAGAGLSGVGILPGEMNLYYSEMSRQTKNDLPLRYNGTAKRCGFRRDENGLYYRVITHEITPLSYSFYSR